MNPFKPKREKHPVAYTTDPLSVFPFEPSPKQRELAAANKPRYVSYVAPQKGLIRLGKASRLVGHLPGLTPISAEVSYAMLEVIGLPGMESLIETSSQS